jgi:hypothetical protein
MKLASLDWSEWRQALSARLLQDRTCLIYQMPKAGSKTGEFFGIAKPEIINQNIGSAKEYTEAYKEVRRQLSLSVDFLKEQYNANS